jgi:hypothetical protein
MIKNFKKLLVAFIMTLAVSISFSNPASAIGWSITLFTADSHWGTSPCTTGYPKVNFDIQKSDNGWVMVRIQRFTGSNWVNANDNSVVLFDGKLNHSLQTPTINSSTQYRLYAENYKNEPVTIAVQCRGSW